MKTITTPISRLMSLKQAGLMLISIIWSLQAYSDKAGEAITLRNTSNYAALAGEQVVSFSLINTDTGLPIQTLTSGDTLNLAILPTRNLSIRANTSPATVGSVIFALSGTASRSQVENIAPYALFGGTNNNYNSWTPAVGSYTLKATPYPSSKGRGTAGTALTVNFQVTKNSFPAVVAGELKKWHKITLTFTGPSTGETAATNPFLNYRLNVIFSKGNRQIVVPGYFAADGNATESGAISGNKWRVHFTPDKEGSWSYKVSFRTGSNIAVSSSDIAGSPVAFNDLTGSFIVGPSDKTAKDFRAKGRLQYVGGHYLQFAETREYFLKGGANSPENFLAYQDFDGTYSSGSTNNIKTYSPHISDWKSDDPSWKGGKGKGIIGALNYLASKGMNAVYFLTMNVNGDGKDVWPWTSYTERTRFDISKLDQWEVVFTQMDKLGIMMHVVTQEIENDQLLDGGALGVQRKLYYRELIARFGHHLAIDWNLGEENTNTDAQRKEFADYIKSLDPYKSFINVHTYPNQLSTVYTPLLGYPTFDGASLQISNISNVHQETLKWVNQSAASGQRWVVTVDEIGPPGTGVVPDTNDFAHDKVRKSALWGNLMAGGGGVEWYFGYSYPNNDLAAQDWRSRDQMWNITRYALEFFQQYLPFSQMKSIDSLTSATTDYCFALPEEVYAIYLPDGDTTSLNLGTSSNMYQVKWYNPRTGGTLQDGSVQQIIGPGYKSIGNPPEDVAQDWVCLITKMEIAIEPVSSVIPQATVSGESKPLVSVYPNPVKDDVTVQVNLPAAMPLEISLIDIQGRPVYSVTYAPEKYFLRAFSLRTISPGLYFLKVKYGDNYTTRRIVKD